ncbi:MAG: hypothetical protein JNL30_15630 [Rubrivivax sp.]|nr:hypothetical protein [Rubrivivax sp.]
MTHSSRWRQFGAPVATAALAVAVAQGLRHGLVEPAALTARCDAAPLGDAACALRTFVVQSFVQQRLALAALVLALLATFTRWRWAALLALGLGAAGLVLYSSGLAAPAVLLAALVCARPASAQAAR